MRRTCGERGYEKNQTHSDIHRGDRHRRGLRALPQSRGAVGRAAVPPAVLHGARAGRARHAGAQRGAHVLHADVDRARRGRDLRRSQGIRTYGDPARQPLRHLSAASRGHRVPDRLRRAGAGPHAGRRGGRSGPRHALLGRDPRLRVDRERLQQHLGGEDRAQPDASVQRLHHHRRGRAPAVGGHAGIGPLRRCAARPRQLGLVVRGVEVRRARHDVAHLRCALHGHSQYEGAFPQRADRRRGGGHALHALPVSPPCRSF